MLVSVQVPWQGGRLDLVPPDVHRLFANLEAHIVPAGRAGHTQVAAHCLGESRCGDVAVGARQRVHPRAGYLVQLLDVDDRPGSLVGAVLQHRLLQPLQLLCHPSPIPSTGASYPVALVDHKSLGRSVMDLAPWIGEQRYIEMLVLHFFNNPNINGYVGKFVQDNYKYGGKIIVRPRHSQGLFYKHCL